MRKLLLFLGLIGSLFLTNLSAQNKKFLNPERIHYDGSCMTIDGKDMFIYSAAFHYFRCPEELWRDRFRDIKAAGFNTVETYVPWNWHERTMPANPDDNSHFDFDEQTLANALVYHCGIDHLGTLQGEDRPGIVHRLDRDTSGLMLAAKDDDTQRALQDLIRLRTLDRRYITLVHGYVAMDEGRIDTGIARSTRDRQKMAVSDDPFARQAITTFRVLERFDAGRFDDGYTLLECHLYTGRTHQIRVHMRHINHPCVGDPLYGRGGRNAERADRGLTRQFLHSWRVAFTHPVTGEAIECRDELPWDLAEVLDELAPLSLGRTEAGEEIVPQLGLLA